MKLTLCGSIAFFTEMEEIQKQLEAQGHEVKLPPTHVMNETGEMIPVKDYYAIRKSSSEKNTWVWERKAEAIRTHFDKVAWSDAILVLNYDKNNIANYIGSNTLLEMGLAFYLNKKIFLLNPIPQLPCTEEIRAMAPQIINNDLHAIA